MTDAELRLLSKAISAAATSGAETFSPENDAETKVVDAIESVTDTFLSRMKSVFEEVSK